MSWTKNFVALSLVVSVGYGATQVNWDHLAEGATAGAVAKGLLDKANGANVSPMVNTPSKAKEEKALKGAANSEGKAKKLGKTAAGATVIGAIVIGGTELAEPALRSGTNTLGKKLDEPLQENDQKQRDAYCASMPSIQNTSGCK